MFNDYVQSQTAVVTNSATVHKTATEKANVESLMVTVVPGNGRSFVDRSGHVVTNGGLSWTIRDMENYSRLLYYYKTPGADDITSAPVMFANLDSNQGQCHAWMDLLLQTIRAHGINSTSVSLLAPSPYTAFGVKNLTLNPSGGDPISNSGIPGQNMPTPASKLFAVHYMVRTPNNGSTEIYLDPSYGVFKNNISDYTCASIDLWKGGVLLPNWTYDNNAILVPSFF
ncbi:MAG: hypothetical protein LBE12_04125 [Planctomycetaceae bacterium]|nr:hypothetical protein [Planctomycetaceae bacterium]